MSGHEIGVNPVDAYGVGSDAEAYATGFVGLHEDFNGVLDLAKQACANDPEVTGWDSYGEEQASTIAKVEEHGVSLAENIQGAASETAVADQQSGEEFGGVDVPLSRNPNL